MTASHKNLRYAELYRPRLANVDMLKDVTVLQALQIPLIAVSLGGVESLICVPAQGTHACMSPEERKVWL